MTSADTISYHPVCTCRISEREAALPKTAKKKRADDPHDEIDFPTVLWALGVLAVLVLVHRLIWGG